MSHHNNYSIKIALSSVLLYVSFNKLYEVLYTLLLWLNTEVKMNNKPVLFGLNVAIALISIMFLILLANRILTKVKIQNKQVFVLIGFVVFLNVAMIVLNALYGKRLAVMDLTGYELTYLFQFEWNIKIEKSMQVVALIYFLWKMYATGKTEKSEDSTTIHS